MRWLVALLAAAVLMPAGARAQFYDLDGAYRCVTAPDAACAHGEAARPIVPPGAAKAQAPPRFAEAVERVKKRAATPADISLLQARAKDKDPRAVEVLAWCELNGIGMKADAMAAYWLYREAASLGVANAGSNEAAIYETRLSSAQRQDVLLKESAR
jgi:TPR repeat protein